MLEEIDRKEKKSTSIIYTTEQYLKEYNRKYVCNLDYHVYSTILRLFFEKCIKHLFKGLVLNLPIGKFQIQKKYFSPTKLRISFAYTNKLRKEQNDDKVIGYRTKDYMYTLNSVIRLDNYVFKAVKGLYTQIPLHFK